MADLAVATRSWAEFDEFIAVLQRAKCRSYLEIGSAYGESLLRVAHALKTPSWFVAVDQPTKHTLTALKEGADTIRRYGHDVRLLLGDSTNQDIVETVDTMGPFDACFIDANHTLAYVRADWRNYGPMCRIVAFHDIGWNSDKARIDVPAFWNTIKDAYVHREIRHYYKKNGIGIIWRE